MDHILSHKNPLHTLTPYFLKMIFIVDRAVGMATGYGLDTVESEFEWIYTAIFS
jgi:hypothetical protein